MKKKVLIADQECNETRKTLTTTGLDNFRHFSSL